MVLIKVVMKIVVGKIFIGCFVPIIKVFISSMCFALPCVVTLEMEAIDGGGVVRGSINTCARDIM